NDRVKKDRFFINFFLRVLSSSSRISKWKARTLAGKLPSTKVLFSKVYSWVRQSEILPINHAPLITWMICTGHLTLWSEVLNVSFSLLEDCFRKPTFH